MLSASFALSGIGVGAPNTKVAFLSALKFLPAAAQGVGKFFGAAKGIGGMAGRMSASGGAQALGGVSRAVGSGLGRVTAGRGFADRAAQGLVNFGQRAGAWGERQALKALPRRTTPTGQGPNLASVQNSTGFARQTRQFENQARGVADTTAGGMRAGTPPPLPGAAPAAAPYSKFWGKPGRMGSNRYLQLMNWGNAMAVPTAASSSTAAWAMAKDRPRELENAGQMGAAQAVYDISQLPWYYRLGMGAASPETIAKTVGRKTRKPPNTTSIFTNSSTSPQTGNTCNKSSNHHEHYPRLHSQLGPTSQAEDRLHRPRAGRQGDHRGVRAAGVYGGGQP